MSLYRITSTPQVINLLTTSVQTTNNIGSKYCIIRPTVDIFIAIGSNPVATIDGSTCHYIFAGEAFPIALETYYSSSVSGMGDTIVDAKIAAIPASGVAGGHVYISPMSI